MSDRIENSSFHLENSLIPLFIFSQIPAFSVSVFMHFALSHFENPRNLADFQQKRHNRTPEGGHWKPYGEFVNKSKLGP